MDEEEVDGYDSVNRDEQGFPKMETNDGERKVVKGRCLLVRRRADAPVPGDLVEPVTKMLKNFMLAVNKARARIDAHGGGCGGTGGSCMVGGLRRWACVRSHAPPSRVRCQYYAFGSCWSEEF